MSINEGNCHAPGMTKLPKWAMTMIAGMVVVALVSGSALGATGGAPVRVNLANGAHMTIPTGSATSVAFDLLAPSIPDGGFVAVLGWSAGGVYWELDLDSQSAYVQWLSRGGQHGLQASSVSIDDGVLRHLTLTVGREVVLAANGHDILRTSAGPQSAPLASLVLNPVVG